MSLRPGTCLGPYAITAAIGAGGTAFARVAVVYELRRGLAVAKETTR